METDIGNPIEYDPTIDPLNQDKDEDNKQQDQRDQDYYFQPQEMMYQPPPQQFQPDFNKFDLGSIDKSTWIIAFAVFLLGFFMGKTMQPVILRYT